MGMAISGSNGWKPSDVLATTDRNLVQKILLESRQAMDSLKSYLHSRTRPYGVTLGVHNGCNLTCRHCYWQPQGYTGTPLSLYEQERLLRSIVEEAPALISLVGKEVFLGRRGTHLLNYLSKLRKEFNASFQLGVITNGTLIHDFKLEIAEADLDYFDISMNGIKEDHDAVRGKGAFEKVIPNLQWAAETFEKRLFVSHVLSRQNISRLKEAIDLYHQLGVRNICIGFYKPLAYTDAELTLSTGDLNTAFRRLEELGALVLHEPTNVIFDLDLLSLPSLKAFMRSTWFDVNLVEEDALGGEHFIEYEFDNGIKLIFRITPYPIGIWRAGRITPEGAYLAAEDILDVSRYAESAVANVRDFDLDFAALHAYALDSARFRLILEDYHQRILPDLQSLVAPPTLSRPTPLLAAV